MSGFSMPKSWNPLRGSSRTCSSELSSARSSSCMMSWAFFRNLSAVSWVSDMHSRILLLVCLWSSLRRAQDLKSRTKNAIISRFSSRAS